MATQEDELPGALDGIRVLDLTRYQAGPACTVMLADMGAEVIKVETPGRGDEGRYAFRQKDQDVGAYFLAMNHGKRGITVDYRLPQGRDVLLRLLPSFDVVVENFRPGTATALGLGYDECKRVNERIVYAAVSAFGEKGPMREMAGFDIHAQAVGGIMSTTGSDDGAYPAGAAIGDQTAGMTLCTAVLGALLARERQGMGQKVSVSLYGCQLALQTWEISYYAMTRKLPPKAGTGHPTVAASGVIWSSYATRDGHITLGVLGNEQSEKFLSAIGIEHEGFEGAEFMVDLGHLDEDIRTRLQQRTTSEWMQTLVAADVQVGRVNNYADILADPQVHANNYVTSVTHTDGTVHEVIGSPITFSETPARIRRSAPALGEDTDDVLAAENFSATEIAQLREDGVI